MFRKHKGSDRNQRGTGLNESLIREKTKPIQIEFCRCITWGIKDLVVHLRGPSTSTTSTDNAAMGVECATHSLACSVNYLEEAWFLYVFILSSSCHLMKTIRKHATLTCRFAMHSTFHMSQKHLLIRKHIAKFEVDDKRRQKCLFMIPSRLLPCELLFMEFHHTD